MNKELQELIFKKRETLNQKKSFKQKILLYKINKRIDKIITLLSKENAKVAFKQTYDLLFSIVDANF